MHLIRSALVLAGACMAASLDTNGDMVSINLFLVTIADIISVLRKSLCVECGVSIALCSVDWAGPFLLTATAAICISHWHCFSYFVFYNCFNVSAKKSINVYPIRLDRIELVENYCKIHNRHHDKVSSKYDLCQKCPGVRILVIRPQKK